MGKYGQDALSSVMYIQSGQVDNPIDAWERATIEIFGEGTPSQVKGCPKNTFLGLCEDGLVKGIKAGSYTKSKKNKGYAIKAIELIRKEPNLSGDPDFLWNRVQDGVHKAHNYQMNIITAL